VAGRGTDRRAATIPAYYKRQLRNLDTEFHGTVDRQVGPLERRLAGFGSVEALVAGPWGEVSKDLASLIHTLAEYKMAAVARSRGQRAEDWEIGQTVAQMRRYLSCTIVRAQSLCLLNRVCYLGEGGGVCGGPSGGSQEGRGGKEGRGRCLLPEPCAG
jgi:hypothetical protein